MPYVFLAKPLQYRQVIGVNRDGRKMQGPHDVTQGHKAAVGEAAAFYLKRSRSVGAETGYFNYFFGGL